MYSVTVRGIEFQISKRYRNLKPIGSGAYGVVCAAEDAETGRKVAIKKVQDTFADLTNAKRILRELKLLWHFNGHDNIINIVDVMTAPSGTRDFIDVYIVTELMESDLERIIQSKQALSTGHVKYFLYQVLRGLKYVHSANVLHRDLKPSNLLINSNCELAICDFGLARGVGSAKELELTGYVVTRWYRAPELLLDCKHYGAAVDVWAVGCILAELLNRRPLLPGRNFRHQLQLTVRTLGTPSADELSFIEDPSVRRLLLSGGVHRKRSMAELCPSASAQALDLLGRMLVFDPRKRISVEEALSHPFLADYHNPEYEPRCAQPFPYDEHFVGLCDEAEDALRSSGAASTTAPELTRPEIQDQMYRMLLKFHPDALTESMQRESRMTSVLRGEMKAARAVFQHQQSLRGEGDGSGGAEAETGAEPVSVAPAGGMRAEESKSGPTPASAASAAASTGSARAAAAQTQSTPAHRGSSEPRGGGGGGSGGSGGKDLRVRVHELEEANAKLEQQLARQRSAADSLSERVLALSNQLATAHMPRSEAGAAGAAGASGLPSTSKVEARLRDMSRKLDSVASEVLALRTMMPGLTARAPVAGAGAGGGAGGGAGATTAGAGGAGAGLAGSGAPGALGQAVDEAMLRWQPMMQAAVAEQVQRAVAEALPSAVQDALQGALFAQGTSVAPIADASSGARHAGAASPLSYGFADLIASHVAARITQTVLEASGTGPRAPGPTPGTEPPPDPRTTEAMFGTGRELSSDAFHPAWDVEGDGDSDSTPVDADDALWGATVAIEDSTEAGAFEEAREKENRRR